MRRLAASLSLARLKSISMLTRRQNVRRLQLALHDQWPCFPHTGCTSARTNALFTARDYSSPLRRGFSLPQQHRTRIAAVQRSPYSLSTPSPPLTTSPFTAEGPHRAASTLKENATDGGGLSSRLDTPLSTCDGLGAHARRHCAVKS